MNLIDKLSVIIGGRKVGTLTMTPDKRLCAFEYDKDWLADGFSISPFELPLKQGVFIAKPTPFLGDFGIFEDSLPDGYGRYLLNRMLRKKKNLLNLTGYFTQSPRQVEEMFRRMVFNVAAENKDDHPKNFAFICRRGKWTLAPAYDLTHCVSGYNGEHATSVNNNGNPTDDDMIAVGLDIRIPKQKCVSIINEVRSVIKEILSS